jgi:hypothetical protein
MDVLTNAGPATLQAFPPVARQEYIVALVAALRPVFLVAASIGALGFALTFFLQEIELRDSIPAEAKAEVVATPGEGG